MIDFSKVLAKEKSSETFIYWRTSIPPGFEKINPKDLFWDFEQKDKWLNSFGEFDIRILPADSVIWFFIPAFFDFAFASLTYNSKKNHYPENVKQYFKKSNTCFEDISNKLQLLENDILFSYNHYLSNSEILGNNTESKISIIQRIRKVYAVFEKHYFHLVANKQIVSSADRNIYETILVLIFSFKHELISSIEMFAIKPFKECISLINKYKPTSTFAEPFRFFDLLISRSLENTYYFEFIRNEELYKLEVDFQTNHSFSLIFNESLQPEKMQDHYMTIEKLIREIKDEENLKNLYLLECLKHIKKVIGMYSSLLPKIVLAKKTEELKKQYLYLSALIDINVSDSQKTVFIVEKSFQLFEVKMQLLKYLRGIKISPDEWQFNLFSKKSEGHYFISAILSFDTVFKKQSGKAIEESQLFYLNKKPFKDVSFRKQISRMTGKIFTKSNVEFKNRILANIQAL